VQKNCLIDDLRKTVDVTGKDGKRVDLSCICNDLSFHHLPLFFFHALQLGNASHVVPIDKLSVVLTMGFARLVLGEKFSKQSIIGLGLLTLGTLIPVFL